MALFQFKMMTFKHITEIIASKDSIFPCFKDEMKSIQKFLPVKNPDFEAEFSTYQLLYGPEGNRIYLVGLGERKEAVKMVQAFQKLSFEQKKFWKEEIQVYTNGLSSEEIKKAAIGIAMSNYEIGQFKSEQKKSSAINISFASAQDITETIEEAKLTGETINRIKALVDAPANHKTPEFLANWAEGSAAKSNYSCTVLRKDELEKQGFDAVLAVGKGSVNPPVVIVTEYKAKKDAAFDIGLVGKGITFDTGGLSIKPSQNLHYMKSDMGGAAVVLGVVELVAKLKLNINVIGVVASAENAVDASSYRPGDVINSYSGKTIEIIDTDAEGRLVLADALSYVIQKYQPKQIIDLATLTGSVVRTLGNSAAGMFTHNQKMAGRMMEAGDKVHERVWPLPLYEDFDSDLHSDIADLRNFSGKPVAGAINAAKFLESFTDAHKSWMHLDIAGVAFGDSKFAKMKSASGYGIQLITEYIKSLN
ncbi:MAG: leucyl aminopeptidase family protein [Flavobacteriaceae bacterium]|nr:leucyl aminopeptidase family protein [Flavobacteriaceae bacterium]